jgi:PAS domain S-box-containing protein
MDNSPGQASPRLSADQLATVLRHITDGVTVQTPGGELVYANDAAAELVGFRSAEELLQSPAAEVSRRFDVFDEEDAPLPPDRYPGRRVLRGEDRSEVVLKFRTRDSGDVRWALVTATPIRGDDGAVRFAVNVFRDITDRRRAEIAQHFLAEASSVLASSLDYDVTLRQVAHLVVPRIADWCAVYVVDPDGTIERLASAHVQPAKAALASEIERIEPIDAEDATGVAAVIRTGRAEVVSALPGDQPGKPPLDARTEALIRQLGIGALITAPLVARGRVLGAMTFGQAESGRQYAPGDVSLAQDLASRAATAIDNARLYRDAGRARDRTGRLQAVTAAFSSARTLAEVTEIAVTEGCAALDSPRGLLSLFLESEEVLETVRMVGFPEHTATAWRRIPMELPAPLTEAARSGEPGYYETPQAVWARYPHLAGLQSPGDQALAALPLVLDRRTLGAIGLVFDQPRSFTEEDRRYLVGFARLCAQALDRAMLYESEAHARREAEAANRAKDVFLATVSHELRTPLTAILGWSRMLRAGAVNDERRGRALETIERNAKAQVQLVEDLLDISRVTSGQLRLASAPVDLRAVTEAALEAVRPLAEAKGVALRANIDPGAGSILGDAGRIQQCIWNLLTNAVKFTPGGGSIEATVERTGPEVRIRVADSGEGIVPEFLPFVFDRFRQADSSMARSHGGLGLGLAIVKHLVTLHGGSVQAESAGRGQGSTFVVRLPLSPPRASLTTPPPDIRPIATSGTTAPAEITLDGLRILAVDDDPDTRDLVRAVLEERRAAVTTAASALEGLTLLQQLKPDVLVTDIGMPGETGYDLLRAIRALPHDRGGGIPAVALTAFARQEDRSRALEAGFSAHVAKPVEPIELVMVIADLAGRAAGPASGPAIST